jgi:hypothetical protein
MLLPEFSILALKLLKLFFGYLGLSEFLLADKHPIFSEFAI